MATVTIKLKPWIVPNFVYQSCTHALPPAISLSQVDAHTLADMCDAFRAGVFRKAGKADPIVPDQEQG